MTGKYLATPGWSRLCLLLDYDGTLAPHGAHPDLTVLPPATKEVSLFILFKRSTGNSMLLLRCCNDLRTCLRFLSPSSQDGVFPTSRPRSVNVCEHVFQDIVSQENIKNIFQDIVSQVNIKNITYAGNHGLDIVHPDGTKFVPPLPEEVKPNATSCFL